MESENKTYIGFWEKIKLTKDFVSVLMVFIGLGILIAIFCIVQPPLVCITHSVSWIEIAAASVGAIALTAALGVPLLSGAAFAGIVWMLVRLWNCTT